MSTPRALNDREARRLLRLYRLHQATKPARLAERYGISRRTLYDYVNGTRRLGRPE